MMKKQILTLVTVLLFGGAFAQQIQLPSPVVTVYGGYEDINLTTHFDVYNNGSNSIDVHLYRDETNVLTGTTNSFCWGVNCYPPTVDQSSVPATIAPGGTETTFSAYYYPNMVQGVSTMDYCWYIDGDQANAVCHTLNWDASFAQSTAELTLPNELGQAYPNPADKATSLSYSVNGAEAVIEIRDMLGAEVQQLKLNEKQGVAIINTTSLRSGVYFYSLKVDGEVLATQKMVVAHR